MKKPMKKWLTLLLIAGGILLIGYPWISNRIYEHQVDSKVKIYEKHVEESESMQITEALQRAKKYNAELIDGKVEITQPFLKEEAEDDIAYESVLNTEGNGLMCFLKIPEIGISIPVYHGTAEDILKKGAGHMEGSALPVGGIGNRSIILAHTGMNVSKLFSDLSELKMQDVFYIEVLNQRLVYQVCDIETVLPEEADRLMPDKNKDLVTLVTCTPYGINSHRLLVTGERISEKDMQESAVNTASGNTDSSPWLNAYCRAIRNGGFAAGIASGIRIICWWIVKKKK